MYNTSLPKSPLVEGTFDYFQYGLAIFKNLSSKYSQKEILIPLTWKKLADVSQFLFIC